jgi:cell division protein FtsN
MATAEPASPSPAGDTAYLYRAALGPRAQDYYLRQFARFDGEGRAGASWNWAAYWATLNWLIYRRMWGWALAYVAALAGLALLIFGVGKLLLDYSATSAWLLLLALLTAAFVVPGLYANAWLYHHLNERISAALREHQDVKAAATALAAQAPGPRRLLWIALANSVLLALAVLLAQVVDGAGSAMPQLAQDTPPPVAAASAVAATAGRAAAAPASAQVASAPQAGASVVAAPTAVASAPAVALSQPDATAMAPAGGATAPEAAVASLPAAPAEAAPHAGSAVAVKTAAAAATVAGPQQGRGQPAAAGRAGANAAPTPQQSQPAAATSPGPAVPAPARARQPHVWVIQVGAYADPANAERALAQVQALGLDAGAESFDAPGKGRLTRVRVGPFTRQAEAERAALRIKALNLPVLLIRQRP